MEAKKHYEEVAPAVVGLAMEAQKHVEHVAPAVVGLSMNAKRNAEEVSPICLVSGPDLCIYNDSVCQISGHVAEWGAKEVAPRAVGLAMEAQKHYEQVAPAIVGLSMNAKDHAEQVGFLSFAYGDINIVY